MIYFLTTHSHGYTHAALAAAMPNFKPMSYPALLARRRLPRATYVFSDVDRLSPWQLEVVARLYRQLAAGGARVVNDPARVLRRLPLLKRLERAGVNSFKAWDAAELDIVDRFPVFIRTRHAHRGVISELLHSRQELTQALEDAYASGFTIADLIVVEYCAETLNGAIYRKHSLYRIGDAYVTATNVHETDWRAKFGTMGVADQTIYDEEHRDIVENTYATQMKAAFELAGIEYGRVDFGIVKGKPEIYEINTNPHIHRPSDHPFPIRVESSRRQFEGLMQAFSVLDAPLGAGVIKVMRPNELYQTPRWNRLLPGYLWQP